MNCEDGVRRLPSQKSAPEYLSSVMCTLQEVV